MNKPDKTPFVFKVIKGVGRVLNFKHNWAIKLLSVVLALLFWIFVMDQVNPQVTKVLYNVPVYETNVENLKKDKLIIMKRPALKVDIEFSGRRNTILTMSEMAVNLSVDLSKLEDGYNLAKIDAKLNLNDVTIKKILPEALEYSVEKKIIVSKPVKFRFSKPFPKHLSRSKTSISPSEIFVTGPKSFVDRVQYLEGSLDASEIKTSKSFEMMLKPFDSEATLVEGVSLNTNAAKVDVEVLKTKRLKIAYDHESNVNDGYEVIDIKFSDKNAVVVGPPDQVNQLNTVNAEKILIQGFESYSGNVKIQLPGDIVLLEPVSPKYTVTIEPIISRSIEFDSLEIDLKDIPEGFDVENMNPDKQIVFTVTGTKTLVESVQPDDLHAYFDLKGIVDEGEYSLRIQFAEIPKIKTETDAEVLFKLTKAGEPDE